MKQDIAKQWVAALRSGDYKQGQGQLKNSARADYYCCLGVLAELSPYPYVGCSSYLKTNIVDWAGLQTGLGVGGDIDLIEENDRWRKSFEQIADIIEANWKAL
jgi:hypothetical protein